MFRDIKPVFWIPTALFAVAITLYLGLFVDYCDTFWYSVQLRPYFSGAVDSPWQGLADTVTYHWLIDNVRLGNIFLILSLLLPEWADWPLFAFAFFVWAVLAARLAGLSPRSVCVAGAVMAVITFMQLWSDSMADECYIYNYPVATALALYVLWLYFNPERHSRAALLLWGLALGWWHEGMGLPLLSGMVAATAIWRRESATSRRLWLMAGIGMGLVVILITPGTYVRSGEYTVSLAKFTEVLPTYRSTVAMLALAVVVAAIGRLRRRADWPLLTILTVSCAAVFAINVRFPDDRVGWFAPVCASIGLLHILKLMANGSAWKENLLRHGLRVAAIALGAVAMIKVCVGADGARRFRPYMQGVYAAGAALPTLREGEEATLFGPVASPFDSPGCFVAWPFYNHAMWSRWLGNVLCEFTYGVDAQVKLIPEQLEYADESTGEAVPGTPGLRRAGNHFFYPVDRFPEAEGKTWVMVQVSFGGFERLMAMPVLAFESRKDGRTYHYLRPEVVGRIVPSAPVVDMKILSWHTPDDTD